MFFVYSFLSINLVIHSWSFFLALVILDGTCFSAKSFVLARLLYLCFGHYSFPSCCATFGHISYIGSPFVYFFTAVVFPLSPGTEGPLWGIRRGSLDIVVYPVMNFIFWLWGQNKRSDRSFTIWYWGVLPVRSNMGLVYSMWKGGSLWFPVKSTSEAICPSCLLRSYFVMHFDSLSTRRKSEEGEFAIYPFALRARLA